MERSLSLNGWFLGRLVFIHELHECSQIFCFEVGYDILDRVTKITNQDNTSKNFNYSGLDASLFDENGNRVDRTLGVRGEVLGVREYNDNETYTTSYSYDSLGNLVGIEDDLGNDWVFEFDSLGRKIAEKSPDVGWVNFSYDGNGNLVNHTFGGGNLVTGDGYYREWNEFGQLVRVRSGNNISGDILEEYSYDHLGVRVKTYNMVKNETVYTPFKEVMVIVNESGRFNFSYVYDGDVLVARINPDGSKWFYHSDHLGSTSLITDESGEVVEDTSYLPFGGVLEGGESDKKLYENKELDETGLYYYGFRYYDPSKRIFVQADSMLPDVYDPQQLNRYMFEKGNPYSYTDPSGHVLVYWGGQGAAGSGAGVSGAGGRVASISFSNGLEFDNYNREGIGLMTPTTSVGTEFGIVPFRSNIADFQGDTAEGGVDFGEGYSAGFGFSYPIKNNKVEWSGFSIGVTLSADFNAPVPASAYLTTSTTTLESTSGLNNVINANQPSCSMNSVFTSSNNKIFGESKE